MTKGTLTDAAAACTIEFTLSAVRTLAAEVVVVVETFEDAEGFVETPHPAMAIASSCAARVFVSRAESPFGYSKSFAAFSG